MYLANFKHILIFSLSLLLISCGGGTDELTKTKPTRPVTILIFGDSISQGYGISITGESYQQITPGNTYTELLRNQLGIEQYNEFATITIINASLGGEYTDEAAERLPSLLMQYKPTHVLLAHGTNDTISFVSNTIISQNFELMINAVKTYNAIPFVVDIPPALYGTSYGTDYSNTLRSISLKTNSIYINLLDGVFNKSNYYLDAFHLNDSAQSIMMLNVFKVLVNHFN